MVGPTSVGRHCRVGPGGLQPNGRCTRGGMGPPRGEVGVVACEVFDAASNGGGGGQLRTHGPVSLSSRFVSSGEEMWNVLGDYPRD